MKVLNFVFATNGIRTYMDIYFNSYIMDDMGNAIKTNRHLVEFFECHDAQFEQWQPLNNV